MKKIMTSAVFAASFVVSLSAMAAGNAESGKLLTEKYNCASCHGKDFNSPIDPSYPKLAGQHQDYLQHALIAYRRGNDGMNGRTNAIMAGQAKALTDKDIQDIAAYLHGLPGSLVLEK
ncbi:cytochrome c553 [Herbaspirillum sp. CF444]|uniref:c-type cytochrome n=1 Tax=Herbaspirillum sp. CF444 TaxID=1144319 RepID=UPI0002727376|nr:cytochrome c [Herbaspirillum sp. CF444]EJL91640.1 cytochrome c553 [Herbaspirillum sp. CF444]